MCAGARATGSRARSGLRGDRDAVSLRGKTPRAGPLARRDFPPSHVAPATVFVRPEHDPVSGLFNGLQGGKVSLQLPSCPQREHDDGLRSAGVGELRDFVILAARQPDRARPAAPVYHILWVRVFRDHTISGRGFNLFKPLRRHFRATPFCRQVLSRRDPDDRNASVQKIDDRLGGLLRDGGTGTNIERPRDFGKKKRQVSGKEY